MNDRKETVTVSSLHLYAEDTTQYGVENNPFLLQYTLNKDMESISSWLDYNYLQANGDKTQGMILGNSSYVYDVVFNGTYISLKEHLKILGVHLESQTLSSIKYFIGPLQELCIVAFWIL